MALDPATLAHTILLAPVWARVGLTAASERLREAAALELATTIARVEEGSAAPATHASWGCRSDVSANTRFDSLSDLTKHQANLLVLCTCGRAQVISTARLARYVMLRNWNNQLQALRTRLRCAACGRRPSHLKATPSQPTLTDPFPRDERGWELLRRRLRD